MIEEQGIVAKREKRNVRLSYDEAYRKQERRNKSRDHDYNDYEYSDRCHNRRIQDQKPAWMG